MCERRVTCRLFSQQAPSNDPLGFQTAKSRFCFSMMQKHNVNHYAHCPWGLSIIFLLLLNCSDNIGFMGALFFMAYFPEATMACNIVAIDRSSTNGNFAFLNAPSVELLVSRPERIVRSINLYSLGPCSQMFHRFVSAYCHWDNADG
jgi:hypothetical protein